MYTEIYKFNKNGDLELFDKVADSFFGSFSIWRILKDKYLKNNHMETEDEMQDIWNLVNDERLTKSEEITLGTTFNGVFVKKEDIAKIIYSFKHFPEKEQTNLYGQIKLLEKLEKDEDCIAIIWNQTSANSIKDILQMENDGNDTKNIIYNFFTNDNHWNLFES